MPTLDEYSTPLEKAAHWYLEWNRMIEPYADIRHRIEDDATALLDKLGINYAGKTLYDDKLYNYRVGFTKSDVDLSVDLAEPQRSEIFEMAKRYGYQT